MVIAVFVSLLSFAACTCMRSLCFVSVVVGRLVGWLLATSCSVCSMTERLVVVRVCIGMNASSNDGYSLLSNRVPCLCLFVIQRLKDLPAHWLHGDRATFPRPQRHHTHTHAHAHARTHTRTQTNQSTDFNIVALLNLFLFYFVLRATGTSATSLGARRIHPSNKASEQSEHLCLAGGCEKSIEFFQ